MYKDLPQIPVNRTTLKSVTAVTLQGRKLRLRGYAADKEEQEFIQSLSFSETYCHELSEKTVSAFCCCVTNSHKYCDLKQHTLPHSSVGRSPLGLAGLGLWSRKTEIKLSAGRPLLWKLWGRICSFRCWRNSVSVVAGLRFPCPC